MDGKNIYKIHLDKYLSARSTLEREQLLGQLTDCERYQVESKLQRYIGVGEDFFSFESAKRQKDPIYDNLLNQDIPLWQRECSPFSTPSYTKAHLKNINLKVPAEYTNQYMGEPIKLYYQSSLVYGHLYSAVHYILHAVMQNVKAWGDAKYCHAINNELNDIHARRKHNLISMSTVNTDDYSQLKAYFQNHYSEWFSLHYMDWFLEVNEKLNHQTPSTFVREFRDSQNLPHVEFICKNQGSLRMVRPHHFVQDVTKMLSPIQYLDYEIDKLTGKVVKQCLKKGW